MNDRLQLQLVLKLTNLVLSSFLKQNIQFSINYFEDLYKIIQFLIVEVEKLSKRYKIKGVEKRNLVIDVINRLVLNFCGVVEIKEWIERDLDQYIDNLVEFVNQSRRYFRHHKCLASLPRGFLC